jgi:chromosome segregation ATPase
MMKKNTYTRAYEACGAFFTETGQMPTIGAIKPIIGVNSPSIISSAIKDWKNALSQTIRKDHSVDPVAPAVLVAAVTDIWEQAMREAKTAIKDKVDELQAKQTALDAKEGILNEEKMRVQQLVHVTEQKFQDGINYLKKEIDQLTAKSLILTEQADHFRAIASDVEKKNAVLTEEIRQEKGKFLRLENQYDKEHEWALKRIDEEKGNYKKQTQNEMQRLQFEATRSKQSSELLQAKVNLMDKQANENRDRIIELERNLSDGKLTMAGLTLNEAKLQNELNAKEERMRLLLNKVNKKGR